MDNESLQHIKDQLFNKKTKDYTNLTFFFLIFSMFAFFVIRPSLTTAFSLQKKEAALKQTEIQYEEIVSRIPSIQSALEALRPDLPLISEALPKSPDLNSILQDIRSGSTRSGLSISRMTVNDVSLVGIPKPALKHMVVEIETDTTYPKIIAFQRDIHNQKRLKKVTKFEILKDGGIATQSGTLKVKMQIEGYYL
ncbi:type 4a pilus biogenesis protein PilO [Candidatus Microgenomates bacterium]|nr:type 4a pilus biogenesis protein PilO [Candidatus Microgenomates bacterium]